MPSCKEFKSSTIASLIEMFNVCPFGDKLNGVSSTEDLMDIMKDGIKRGYLIHPACDASHISHFLATRDMQYNSTFYKTWNDVKNKSRFELFVDQVLHYMTTYGTDFSEEAYIPNVNPEEPAWNTYKVISPITYDDLYTKCLGMLQAGIALKSETVKVLTDYIITYARMNDIDPNIDSIKNREAMVILCDALGLLPRNGDRLFAHIIYKTTGQTMIIKNRDTRNRIQMKMNYAGDEIRNMWRALNDGQMIALAGIYNRYKELFLSYKNHRDPMMNKIINKIGHLSKKHHKPMTRGFWETLIAKETYNPVEVAEKAKTATNFKLIQVMQSIRERLLLAAGMGDNLYIIRNGKVFMKENNYSVVNSKYFNWEEIYQILKDQLIDNLSKKACTVRFSDKFNLACPTSEKNFIGDVPMGSFATLDNEGVFGIYWKNEWGTRDFDLSYNDINGNRIGWNSSYYNTDQNIVYSGDITNAPDGANELMQFKNGCPDGIIYVNRYNGEQNSKFKLFFGKDDNKNWNINSYKLAGSYYMVDPNKVILETMVTQSDAAEMMVGVILDNKVHFVTLSCGYMQVAQATRRLTNNHKVDTEGLTQMLKRKAMAMIDLKEILLAAGFTEHKKDETPEIDFTTLDRSTLIELFS